jgi:endonuclease/exonuclease/phosphatase family metal-dependent hydrolase
VKVLTLNTWHKSGPWQQRWQVILEGIRDHQPDVIAFQEVFDTAWRDIIADRAGYRYRASPAPTPSGLVLLSRFPIFHAELCALSTQSPFEDCKRYVLWAEIAAQGGAIDFFDAHLSWHPQDRATRMAQVQEVWRCVGAKAGADKLLMGDLNATPDSEEIRWLLHEAGLVDTFAAVNPSRAGITWDRRNSFTSEQKPATPDRRIDYILAAGKRLVRSLSSCRIVFNEPGSNGIFASDHYGVLAEFSLQAS